jgi:hypothetical protein
VGLDLAQVHRHPDREAVLVLSAAVAAVALSATPAQGLAAQLKASMSSYYKKSNPGLKFTTVTCKISSDRTTARCNAHFTVVSKRAAGVFVVAVTGAANGNVSTKTLSVSCRDTRTGKKLIC